LKNFIVKDDLHVKHVTSKLHSLRKTQTNNSIWNPMAIPSSSSSPSSTSCYYLSKCILRGTAILQVLYGHFRSPSSMHGHCFRQGSSFSICLFQHIHFFQLNEFLWLLFQETSIELLVIHDDDDGNLQSVCDQPVFGIIKDQQVCYYSPCLVWDRDTDTGKKMN